MTSSATRSKSTEDTRNSTTGRKSIEGTRNSTTGRKSTEDTRSGATGIKSIEDTKRRGIAIKSNTTWTARKPTSTISSDAWRTGCPNLSNGYAALRRRNGQIAVPEDPNQDSAVPLSLVVEPDSRSPILNPAATTTVNSGSRSLELEPPGTLQQRESFLLSPRVMEVRIPMP